jgi:hypothetical protein
MSHLYINIFRQHFDDFLSGDSDLSEQNIRALLINYIKIQRAEFSDFEHSLKDKFLEGLPEFIQELAQAYYDNPTTQDEMIDLCLTTNNEIFLEHLNFLKELNLAIKNGERKRLKNKLIDLENDLTDNEIRIAIIRNQRAERKVLLRNIESINQRKNIASRPNFNVKSRDDLKTTHSSNFSFYYKIAAILIIALIPVSVIILNNKTQNDIPSVAVSPTIKIDSTKTSPNELPKQIHDLAELDQIINTPLESQKTTIELIFEPRNNQAFAGSNTTYVSDRVKITVNSLAKKTALISSYIEELKSAIQNPSIADSTRNQFNNDLKIANDYFADLKAMLNTYNLNQESLTIWTSQTMKSPIQLFELVDYENNQKTIYILRIENSYYNIKLGSGSLNNPIHEDSDLIHRISLLQ